jgi:hypothetical protein
MECNKTVGMKQKSCWNETKKNIISEIRQRITKHTGSGRASPALEDDGVERRSVVPFVFAFVFAFAFTIFASSAATAAIAASSRS